MNRYEAISHICGVCDNDGVAKRVEDVKAWGIIEDGQLVAAIETAVEGWSNRLRVTELWIDKAYRRKGIATALMDIAMKRAKEEKRRVLMLETQSRNDR